MPGKDGRIEQDGFRLMPGQVYSPCRNIWMNYLSLRVKTLHNISIIKNWIPYANIL